MTKCVLCERTSDEVPVIAFEYRGETYHVCTAHLPTLLHKPELFSGKLPEASRGWSPGESHHDHG